MILTDLLGPQTERYYIKERVGNSTYFKISVFQDGKLYFHQHLQEDKVDDYCLQLEREGCHLKDTV